MKKDTSGASSSQPESFSSKVVQSTGTQYSKLDSESEYSTDSGAMYSTFPQDHHNTQCSVLKRETEKIQLKYSSLSQSFKRNFLEQEKSGGVCFDDLLSCAIEVFNFENCEDLVDCKQLLNKIILRQQNYMNFS